MAAKPAKDQDAAPAEKKAASVPLPFLLALVAGLAVGGGAGAFVVGPALASGIAPAVAANAAHGAKAKAAGGHDAEAEEGHGDEAAADEEEGEEAPAEEGGHGKEGAKGEALVYTIDNLVLNPAASGGTRFLLLTISFDLKAQATLDAMKARDAELRDVVLATLGAKTVEQLTDVATRDSLKVELRDAATKLFKKKAIKRVYFPQFVIQ